MLLLPSPIFKLALRKKFCKNANCSKKQCIAEQSSLAAPFFTVYTEYCTLSRYIANYPDGMERSGMESG